MLRDDGWKLALASSSKNAPLILERTELRRYFDATVDGNDITHGKPHPEVFVKAAEALSVAPEYCAAVDDAPAVESITATSVSVGLIAKALAKLSDEAANPVIVMNKATWGEFKAAQAANGYGYDPFEGLPVVFNNSLAAFSAATTGVCYAIVGDFGIGAQANFPNGDEIQIKVDETTKMEYDLVRILGREYVGLGVVAPNAFAMIKH